MILVVEDEFDDVQVISKILRHHGMEVKVARNGQECLTILETASPNLVIMDLAMPKMDGWETLRAMRNQTDTQKIPVVAVTAYHSTSVEEDTINAGFNGYFPKPVNPTSFIKSLEAILASESP